MATSRIDGRAILAGLTSLALIGSLFLVLRAPAALAEEQSNNVYPEVYCGTGDTREEAWHWVHNQVPDGVTSATLTASFEVLTGPDTGSTIQVQVVGDIDTVIHYDLYYPYGLKLLPTPSDDVDGGMLVLSHWPECAYSTTTTTEPSTTSTTDGYTTTSTTEYSTTSTTEATTTSTTEATTTSTTEATTTSTTEATTTSTTEATTTSTTEATTTTLPDEVDDSEVTTTTEPDEVSPTVLPFTGIDSDSIFLIALILISTGVLTVVFVRGMKEWGES